MSARSGYAFACQHFSLSALFARGRSAAGRCAVRSGSILLQAGLTCKLSPCRWKELVERGLLEATFGERLLASVRQRGGLTFGHEGDRTPTETRAGEPGARSTVLFRRFHEGVQLGGRDLEVVAQRGVRGVHQAPESVEVSVLERLDRLQDAGVLGENVSRALQLLSGEERQVPFRGIAQVLDTKRAGRTLARRPPVVVAGVCEAALDTGVADDQEKARGCEIERNIPCLQRTAVHEQSRAGLAEKGGVLVHDAAVDPNISVLGPLADDGEVGTSGPEPEERVEGERRSRLDGRGRGEPRAERHVAGEGCPERPDLMPRLPHCPCDAARVVGPGRVLVYLTRLVEVG